MPYLFYTPVASYWSLTLPKLLTQSLINYNSTSVSSTAPKSTSSSSTFSSTLNCLTKDKQDNTQLDDVEPSVNSQKAAPIGLFDSGIGGLSVYHHLKQVLPAERYIYYADTLNVPYGNRSQAQIVHLTMMAIDWLVAAGCKLIVIACNSASAHALQMARQHYPQVPIVGLVPALKPAVMQSRTKRVAVLATQATLNGALLNQVIADYATPNGVEVFKSFDPCLVPWVEQGMPTTDKTALQLIDMLHQFALQQVDYLILGCTHYPFFREFLTAEIAAKNLGITVVDSGAAIANRVQNLLMVHDKLAESPKSLKTADNPRLLVQKPLVQNPLVPYTNKEKKALPQGFIAGDQASLDHTLYVNTTHHFFKHMIIEAKDTKFTLCFCVTDTHCDIEKLYDIVKRLSASPILCLD